jgi:ferrochelatase
LPKPVVNKLRWIKSYPAHPLFVQAHQNSIREFLKEKKLGEDKTVLLFSAHGVPQKFVDEGDPYQYECEMSFAKIMEGFPNVLGKLCYQSRFGKEEWIKPYTIDICQKMRSFCQKRKEVVFVPLSFTSDHIETLCEVENDYMTVVRELGLNAYRIPALTLRPDWLRAIKTIVHECSFATNQMLVRR